MLNAQNAWRVKRIVMTKIEKAITMPISEERLMAMIKMYLCPHNFGMKDNCSKHQGDCKVCWVEAVEA